MAVVTKKYGWLKPHKDIFAEKWQVPEHMTGTTVPDAVDLREYAQPVYDQQNVGSCVANSVAGAIEMLQILEGKHYWTPSRLFTYYCARVIDNTVDSDAGTSLTTGCQTLTRFGFTTEDLWAYDTSKFTKKPPVAAYRNASEHRGATYAPVNQNLYDLQMCLADKNPVVFGFSVYDSFESDTVASTGQVPIPKKGENLLGGHAVLLVGYNNGSQKFLVKNSWGTGWGMQGFFEMPYEFILNTNLCDDFWTISYVNGK